MAWLLMTSFSQNIYFSKLKTVTKSSPLSLSSDFLVDPWKSSQVFVIILYPWTYLVLGSLEWQKHSLIYYKVEYWYNLPKSLVRVLMPMTMQRLYLRENHSLMRYAFFLANHAISPMLKDIACYVFTKHLKRHPLCCLLVMLDYF